MSGVCAYANGTIPLETTGKGHKIISTPVFDANHRRRICALAFVPYTPGLWVPGVHHPCGCNEFVSAINRVLGVTPEPRFGPIARLHLLAASMGSCFELTHKRTYLEVVYCFEGKRRTKYARVRESLCRTPFSAVDAKLDVFVKCERTAFHEKGNTDPRMISARTPRYNVHVGQWLKAIEPQVYELSGSVWPTLPPDRVIAKGLNQVERGNLLYAKWCRFGDPVCISLDASRFDKHVNVDLLRVEHSVYNAVFCDEELAWVLALQLRNECYSRNGLHYVSSGGRMSGDMNTALGNCILMILMVVDYCLENNIPYDMLDDGDDCLLIVERVYLDKVLSSIKDHFLTFGMKLKLENIAYTMEEIVFCQSRPIAGPWGYKLVRDYLKVLSCTLTSTNLWTSPKSAPKFLHTLGRCELALSIGVPVLQEFAVALMRISRCNDLIHLDSEGALMIRVRRELRGRSLVKVKPDNITSNSRLSFSLAFGFSVQQQLDYERRLRLWDFDPKTTAIQNPGWEVEGPNAEFSKSHVWVASS